MIHPFLTAAAFAATLGLAVAPGTAAPPHRYDHVVIVIEENESQVRIMGNRVDAPYINELADGGVSFAQFYAITHPSEPNYLHLFSGDNQGVLDDGVPAGVPFSTPNLGAALLAAGATFANFSEDLPAIGDATSVFAGGYRRKHNPWTNWQAPVGAATIPFNQIPAGTNRRFLDFPADFSQLPEVAFVIPTELHNMHDGTIRMADDWLRANLGAYARWARKNNSLLIITFDEDDFTGPNRIPVVFYGAGLVPGTVNAATWTLHNLLRTVADMFGAAAPARSAQVPRIEGIFPRDLPAVTVRFQDGVGGYAGGVDTTLQAASPDVDNSAAPMVSVGLDTDGATAGFQPAQALVQFDDVLGPSPGQIPAGATILSAKLIFWTGNNFGDDITGNLIAVHRMIAPWSPGDTWNSLNAGISHDDVEAAVNPTFTHAPQLVDAPCIFDVTADVAGWLGGAPNHGWALLPTGSDLWVAQSAESGVLTKRPILEVTYTVPTSSRYADWQLGQFGLSAGSAGTLPDDDPDRDGLTNLVEYAINTHPLLPSGMGLPNVRLSASNHTFCFTRNLAALDVTIQVQANDGGGLSDWTTVATRVPAIGWVVASGFTLTDKAGYVEISEALNQSRFFRIKVTSP